MNFACMLHFKYFLWLPHVHLFSSYHIYFFLQSHPGGLLFTKFGSNQTALLDLAFPVMLSL